MKYPMNPAWPLILFGLVLATIGWALKLGGYPQANACIVAGNGLVLLFGAVALWILARRLDTGLRGPLGIMAAGLLVSMLAASSLVASIAMALAIAGGALATGGTVWLLVRLNHTLDGSAAAQQRKNPA